MAGVSPSIAAISSATPSSAALDVQPLVLGLEEGARPLAQLVRHFLVEAFDPGEVLERHEGHILDLGEAFGHQQMGDDVVDVERVDEELRAGAELLGAALGFLRPRSGCRYPSR